MAAPVPTPTVAAKPAAPIRTAPPPLAEKKPAVPPAAPVVTRGVVTITEPAAPVKPAPAPPYVSTGRVTFHDEPAANKATPSMADLRKRIEKGAT